MRNLFLVFFACLSLIFNSQTAEIIKSPITDHGYKNYIGQNNESVYFVETPDKKSFLKEVAKSDLHLVNEIQFMEPESTYGDLVFSKYCSVGNKVYFIEGVHVSKNKAYRLYASLLNKNGTFGERVLLAEKSVKKKKNCWGLWVTTSNDNSKLIVHNKNLTEDTDNTDFTLTVVDENLAKLYSKSFNFPYAKESELPDDTWMQGDYIYFLGKTLIDSASNKKDMGPLRKLYCWNIKTDKLNERTFGNDSLSCYSYSLYVRNQEVVLAGVYTDLTLSRKNQRSLGAKANYLNGFFYTKFSQDLGTISAEKSFPMPVPDNANRDPLSPNAEYYFAGANFFDDGSIAFAIEQHWVSSSNSDGMTVKNHGYNDILIINVSSSGEKKWELILEKHQTSLDFGSNSDKRYHSFLLLNGDTFMQLLLNARPFDMNVATVGAAKVLKLGTYEGEDEKGHPYLIAINSHGSFTIKEIKDVTQVVANKYKIDMGKQGILFLSHSDKLKINKIFSR